MKRTLSALVVGLFLTASLACAGVSVPLPALPATEPVEMTAIGQCGPLIAVAVVFDVNTDGKIDLRVVFAVDKEAEVAKPILFIFFPPDGPPTIVAEVRDGQYEEMSVDELKARFPKLCDLPALLPRA